MSPPSKPGSSSSQGTHEMPPYNKENFLHRVQSNNASKYITIALASVAMFLDNLSVSGLVYAQQGVAARFGASESEASWTLSAYSLTFGSFLLLAGTAGDVFGHKIIFVAGLALFTLCSVLAAAISSSLIGLIVIRAFQGIAAAGTIPTAYALVAITVEGKARQTAVTMVGAAQCIGIVTGTILGGVFVTTPIGYNGLFWLCFGLSAVSTVAAYIFIAPSPSQFKDWKRLDYVGAILITAAMLFLVLGFSYGSIGWRRAIVIAPLIVGGLGIIVFGVWEMVIAPNLLSTVNPLIPNRVWGYKNLIPVLAITALYYATFFSFQLNGAQYLVRVQDNSTIIASLMFLPIAGGAMLVMPLFGTLYNHRLMPPKWVLAAGQTLLVVAILLFTRNGLATPYWPYTFPSFVLVPLGAASFFVNFLNLVFGSAPAEEQGLISGIAQTLAQICTALGFSIASSFITDGTREELRVMYNKGFYFSMALAATSVIVAVIFVRPIPHRGLAQRGDVESEGQAPAEGPVAPEDTPATSEDVVAEK